MFKGSYLKKRTNFAVLYYLSNFSVLGFVGNFIVQAYNLPNYSFVDRLTHFSYGLAIAFNLLPLHEYIHVLAYRSQGATNTSYDANL